MKKRKVWRYTCDHCGKGNCSAPSIRSHECRCFRNPARACPICERQWPIPELAVPMEELLDVDNGNEAALIKAISDVVESCPACILSAILQADIPTEDAEYHREDGSVFHRKERHWIQWDYKVARAAYNAEKANHREETAINESAFD